MLECARTEQLNCNTLFKDRENNCKSFVKGGTVVNVNYSVEVSVDRPETIAWGNCENVVRAMFSLYGDECADSKFLTQKIQEHFPKMKVEQAIVIQCYKEMSYHYPGRMGGRTVYTDQEDILAKLKQSENCQNV
jgi:hypothetical protein